MGAKKINENIINIQLISLTYSEFSEKETGNMNCLSTQTEESKSGN